MKTITKTTTVTTENGTVLNMTVVAVRGYEEVTQPVWVDETVERTSRQEINETTTIILVSGQKYEGSFSTFVPDAYKSKGVYAIFAGKIGLSERVYNELNAAREEAIAEAETDENWIVFQTLRAQSLKAEEDYQRQHRAVEKMMSY